MSTPAKNRDAIRMLAYTYASAHPAEVARVLERAGTVASELLGEMPPSAAATVVAEMVPAAAADLLEGLPAARAARLVEAMPLAAAAAIARRLGEAARTALLAALNRTRSESLRHLLAHRSGTAGALLDPMVTALDERTRVGDAIEQVRRSQPVPGEYVYVLGDSQRLVGWVRASALLTAAPDSTLRTLMHADPPWIAPTAGLDAITSHPAWRSEHALPVVDGDGRLLGAIPYETARRIERQLGKSSESEAFRDTALALAELYGIGLTAMLEWATAPVRESKRAGRTQ